MLRADNISYKVKPVSGYMAIKAEEAAAHAEAEERAAEAVMAEAATQIAAARRRRNSVEMTKKLNLSVDGQGGGGEPDWRNRSC